MRLTFVGDIALGDHPKAVGFGFRSRYANGIPAEFGARLLPAGQETDFFFGNLEFPLGFETMESPDLARSQCRGLSSYAKFLAGAGVSALNVATNHSTQAGRDAFLHTTSLLTQCGVHPVGTPMDFTDRGTLDVRGTRIALLGWSDRPRQYSPDAPAYNEFSEIAYDEIAAARRRADIVVASIHWGDEFILVPSDRERQIAHAMVDAGATCVIGHHPHVIREVEHYRDAVIAYSLGNFVCDMTWDDRTRATAWLELEVEGGRVVSWSLVPSIIRDDYFPAPPPLAASDNTRLATLETVRRSEAAAVARNGYAAVAERERRRHASRTALMMLRNVGRYDRGIALQVFGGALSHRLRKLLPGRRSVRARRDAAPLPPAPDAR